MPPFKPKAPVSRKGRFHEWSPRCDQVLLLYYSADSRNDTQPNYQSTNIFQPFNVFDPSPYLPCDLVAIIRRHQPFPLPLHGPQTRKRRGSKGAGLFPRIALTTASGVAREGPSVPEIPNQVRRTKYRPNLAHSRPLERSTSERERKIRKKCVLGYQHLCTNTTFGISIRSKTRKEGFS